MNILGIFIGAAGLLLVILVVWLLIMSARRNKVELDKKKKQEKLRLLDERNSELERQHRIKKAEDGHIPTILYLAKEAERRDRRESFYWYEIAANLDNVMGMYGLVRMGRFFANDLIIEQKLKYWELYIKGIEGDNASLFYAGKALINGLGVTSNLERGLEIIGNAASRNYIPAIIYLGDWSIAKENPHPKSEDANYWYAKAAKLDNPEAMMKLGINYLNGVGTSVDHRRACYWLESASEMGYPEAMYHAGSAWIDHGSHGNAIAYIWLFLSAYFKYEPAKSLRDEVGNQVGVDSIIVLQRFTKPLIKKMENGAIGKHLIIKALNKLYKRDVPILSHNEQQQDLTSSEQLSESLSEHSDNELLDELSATVEPAPGSFNYSYGAHNQSVVTVPPDVKTAHQDSVDSIESNIENSTDEDMRQEEKTTAHKNEQ